MTSDETNIITSDETDNPDWDVNKKKKDFSVLSWLRKRTNPILVAIGVCLGAASITWCSEDDDPPLVSEEVMKEVENYQKTLDGLKAQFEYINKVYPFTTEEQETISEEINYAQILIQLKTWGTVNVNGSSIDQMIKDILNNIRESIQNRQWILISWQKEV